MYYLKKFNESNYGYKIKEKIQLIEDLSLELKDIGLYVDVVNGKIWSTTSISPLYEQKSIVIIIKDADSILDKDGYYENELKDKPEILNFKKTLESYYKKVKLTGFSDNAYFYIPK